MKDSISDKQADNVSLPEKSLCNLNEKAPDPAIEHGASLTPTHVGGVLLVQIQNDDLCKLKETVTDDAPLQGITVPCSFVQVSQETSYSRAVKKLLRLVSMSTQTWHAGCYVICPFPSRTQF
jgi:hypothetical protein